MKRTFRPWKAWAAAEAANRSEDEGEEDGDYASSSLASAGSTSLSRRRLQLNVDRSLRKGQLSQVNLSLDTLHSDVADRKRETADTAAARQAAAVESVLTQETMEDLFDAEATVTSEAAEAALTCGAGFKAAVARQLIGFMIDVSAESAAAENYQLLWTYFRALRTPMMSERCAAVGNRNRLRRWIHTCNRLARIDRGIPRYRRLRMKWCVARKKRRPRKKARSPPLTPPPPLT